MKYFAGIGSRETPIEFQEDIDAINYFLSKNGYVLRSGGADGSDKMFETSWKSELKEIYLPWRMFNDNPSELYNITSDALILAEKYHPAWNKLTLPARKLMARNGYQVLGEDLETPSDFIVCWTSDGKASGGTGQAIRIANDRNIPVFNLFNRDKALQGISDFVSPRTLF